MYYYAFIDESNTCTGVYALPSQITTDNYIPITEEQYNTQSVVGKVWDAETQTWNDPIVFACTTDEVDYKETGVQLTEKLDAMDAAIAGKANSSDLHSHSNKTVLDGITAEKVATWDSGTAGESGENGATFTPSVSTDGVLSWTNDKGLANPTPVNIKGADGTNGTNGVDGAKGDKGDPFTYDDFTAAQLATLKGEQGIQGVQGVKGDTGANGQDGKSAYQIAVDNGFEGTETQWLASLKGDKGDNGESGADITATEILTKLKTVDGQNSGLDADMLDGHDTNYFATATQLDGKATKEHTHSEYATTASVTALSNELEDTTENLTTAINGKAASNHNHNTVYAAKSHTHAMSEVTGLATALSGKASTDHTHTGYATVDHIHSEYATKSSVTALTNTVNGKANASHTHSEYATNDDLNSLAEAVSGKAAANHTHSQYTTLETVLATVYPVGSIYTSVSSNINPSAIFGGTWVIFGVGRVLMGVDTTSNAEETGGNSTVTLAAHKHTTAGHVLNLNEIPSHNHALLNYNVDGNTSYTFTNNSVEAKIKKGFDGNVMTTYKGGGQSHSHGDTGAAGGATINVVQPYITCFMWKRTA